MRVEYHFADNAAATCKKFIEYFLEILHLFYANFQLQIPVFLEN